MLFNFCEGCFKNQYIWCQLFSILSKLKAGRSCFQDLVSKHSSDVDEVTVAFTEYVGLLRGLVDAPEGGESKLRGLTSFKWTSTCLGRTPRYVWCNFQGILTIDCDHGRSSSPV